MACRRCGPYAGDLGHCPSKYMQGIVSPILNIHIFFPNETPVAVADSSLTIASFSLQTIEERRQRGYQDFEQRYL